MKHFYDNILFILSHKNTLKMSAYFKLNNVKEKTHYNTEIECFFVQMTISYFIILLGKSAMSAYPTFSYIYQIDTFTCLRLCVDVLYNTYSVFYNCIIILNVWLVPKLSYEIMKLKCTFIEMNTNFPRIYR